MTHQLTSLAQGKVAILLEGGYNLDSISNSMASCVHALLGDPLSLPKIGPVLPEAAAAIQRVIQWQRKYWTGLDSQQQLSDDAMSVLATPIITPENNENVISGFKEKLKMLP